MDTTVNTQTAENVKLAKPRAVLFDWDDTLVDSWKSSVEALNTTLVAMGHEAWPEEEMRRRAGPSARELFPALFGDDWEKAEKVFYDTFNQVFLKNICVLPGAVDLLNLLRDNQVMMCVVSNKRNHYLRAEAEHLKWENYFKKIVGAGDAARDKPSPDPALLALSALDIPAAEDVWFIGDSHTDMMCAHTAGCTPVLLETKLPPEDVLKKYPPALRVKDCFKLMEYTKDYFT